jgi:hypothetical protein
MVYFAHFYSHISYGIVFWNSASSVKNVLIIQKRAVRIILRLGPRSSCREGLKKWDILSSLFVYLCLDVIFYQKYEYLSN